MQKEEGIIYVELYWRHNLSHNSDSIHEFFIALGKEKLSTAVFTAQSYVDQTKHYSTIIAQILEK